MKMMQIKKHSTPDIQHSTSKNDGGRGHWLFDVECWLLNVSGFRLGGILLAVLAGCTFVFAQSSSKVPGAKDYSAFTRFVTERNIFDPNRQPHYTSSRTRTTQRTTRPHSSSAPAFTLVGTMSYGKGLFAFFNGNNEDLKKALPVAEKIAGYTVAEISQGRVTLESADKKSKLHLQVGDVMRQESGKWELSGSGEQPAGDSSAVAETSSSSGSESPAAAAAAASPALEQNDVLKKLMEKRAKESQ